MSKPKKNSYSFYVEGVIGANPVGASMSFADVVKKAKRLLAYEEKKHAKAYADRLPVAVIVQYTGRAYDAIRAQSDAHAFASDVATVNRCKGRFVVHDMTCAGGDLVCPRCGGDCSGVHS